MTDLFIGLMSRYTSSSAASAVNIQTTLCELTAQTISTAIHAHAGSAARLMVCGGGVHNSFLMGRLAANMPGLVIESTAAFGVIPDWVEATAFAWLAKQHIEGKPGNIPAVTGASRAVLLGQLFRH